MEKKMKLEELVGKRLTEEQFDEAAGKKDACYHKVKARYDVWPSAYASGALVKCRKVGAANWGNKSKKEGVNEGPKIDSRLHKGLKKIQDDSYKLLANYRTVPGIEKLVSAWMDGLHRSMDQLGVMKEFKNDLDLDYDVLVHRMGNFDKDLKKIIKSVGAADKKKGMELMKIYKKHWIEFSLKSKKALQDHAPKEGVKESVNEKRGTCWVGYKQVGMKDKGGKKVPNCVKEIIEVFYEENGEGHGYTLEHTKDLSLTEAEYQGRKVKLGKIMQGDTKKFKVYVKNPKGNVVKVNFGQGGSSASKTGGTMRIRKSNPDARKSFRARHNCDNPGPRHKARYWSCRKW